METRLNWPVKIPYFCRILSCKTQALDSTSKNFLIRITFHGVKNSSLIADSRNFGRKNCHRQRQKRIREIAKIKTGIFQFFLSAGMHFEGKRFT